MNPAANVADARGLTFECRPGCGFCCTASPLVGAWEAPRLGPLVVRNAEGDLRIPMRGRACGALKEDRGCGVYEHRPAVCHLYPYQVHAGRRLQVTVSLACPGIAESHDLTGGTHPFGQAAQAEDGARRALDLALAQPGATQNAARARETFAEFDRRMMEWGERATPDQLRAMASPHVDSFARPELLPSLFEGLAAGDLACSPKALGALFEGEAQASLADLLEEGARDAFAENADVLWVEPWREYAWRAPTLEDVDLDALPTVWSQEASGILASYLRRLLHRDHAEGAAAWLVDASGYHATPAAAYARVLGEAALQVALRAGMLAEGAEDVDAETARRGVMAYETSFHSLPTLGSIL